LFDETCRRRHWNLDVLIVNADDWGRDQQTTDRTLECVSHGAVTSASAMVFMEDSERGAAIACERGVDAGLHLNFTTPFSSRERPTKLAEEQRNIAKYLLANRFSQAMFNPVLSRSFEYVVSAQIDEFERLYGEAPKRIDGHHHMHLCANVLLGGLLPPGTRVRRNFSFHKGQKGWGNRLYRSAVDSLLARRHELSDFFYSIAPIHPVSRLNQICWLAERFVVELETHPINEDEYRFLTEGALFRAQRHALTVDSCILAPGANA
jgi:hypothetical protein